MPNRYEREIEEILRNLEHAEPKQGLGQKFGERIRRKPGLQTRPRSRSAFSLRLSTTEWFLVIAVIAALLAGGFAYANGSPTLFTGVVSAFALVCLLLVMLSQFIFQPRHKASTDYKKITRIRRGPFTNVKTQWNLFMLKLRYRRKNNP